MFREVVIVDAVRTPIGRYNGQLKNVRPDDLGAIVIKALMERNPELPVDTIDDVILGNANGAGEENRNVARMSSLLAGLPQEVSGTTVNRLCGSSLDAVSIGARAILSGECDVIIAGGTESMSRAPFVMAKPERAFPRGDQTLADTTIGWRFINPKMQQLYGVDSMPQTAENVARRYEISREEQDAFAVRSQHLAGEALAANKFQTEIVPVVYKDRKGIEHSIDIDEHPRPDTTIEKLNSLSPLFEGGTVTAGNATGVNDGASAMLLMEAERAKSLGLQPLVKFIGSAAAGLEPSVMGLGPIYSTRKLMKKYRLNTDDFDLMEINEAFASQSIACIQELGFEMDKVNVNGGAIALGHPLGASGSRILTTLIYEMKRRHSKRGLATMCIGVGQGISVAVENIE
ncbi:acetyl-CoA C-acyltransferase [Mammaliicoccus sciuri]|uniref:acetyl-CoA C-acyltransferase n=1 Tax=Sporosarcina newyorkensis TaxID=759851 RepID=A0A1T4Y9V8_9BACL|nr:acetyl-CoA C-acyltransferase [Sporosarcina newyorkensis]SKA98592.1 3-oxo-5,6-didehydrosuberyl-CoA/3-oxoadipyl-CoA thiolase [Sporosarcina newyorkensis]